MINTWILSEIVRVSTFVSIWAVVFIIKLFASLFSWFWSVNLSSKSVRKVTAKSIFAVSHVVMNTWIKASVDVLFAAVFFTFAFFDCKVLISANILDHFKLTFEFFVLKEFFVVHFFFVD